MAQTPMMRVTALTDETYKSLSELEREQFPFALAKTLTETAQGAVLAVRMTTRKQFTLRSDEFIPKGIRKISARKSDIKATGVGTSAVFTMDRISGFMPIHEVGGIRTATVGEGDDKGKYLAQPGEALKKLSYRTGRGAVKKRYQPATLLNQYNERRLPASVYSQVIQGKVRRKKSQPFIIRGRASGVPMIVRRPTNAQYPIQVLYVFSKKAKYKKQWRFEPTVLNYVNYAFEKKLKRNLVQAVNTATLKSR